MQTTHRDEERSLPDGTVDNDFGGQKKRQTRSIIRFFLRASLVALLVFLFLRLFFGSTGLVRQFHIERENKEMAKTIDSLKIQLDTLKENLRKLREDPLFQEKLARTKLGMSRPGEKVFQFVPSMDSVPQREKTQPPKTPGRSP